MMNETYPLINHTTQNNSGLLWMLHAPFWQQMFFVTMAAGIITFVHIMGWIDWRKIWKEIKVWILWVKTIELPNEKKKRNEFFKIFRKKSNDKENSTEEIENYE